MIIYTSHFHEIAFSFQGLVIIYTRNFREIDFSLIFKFWSSFTLGREYYHEIACFFSSFGDHLHKTCGQKTMPQALVGLSPPKDLYFYKDFEWGYRRKIIWFDFFLAPPERKVDLMV